VNFIDIAILIPVCWGIYRGFSKGFIIELASLTAIGIGIFAAVKFSDLTAAWLANYTELSTDWLPSASFIVTFITAVMLVFLLAKFLEKLINLSALSIVNKIAGAFFSGIKFLLIVSVLVILFEKFSLGKHEKTEKMKNESFLFHPVKELGMYFIPAIKNSRFLKELKKKAETGLSVNGSNSGQLFSFKVFEHSPASC
jgi:membrane protein required for colicin V production